MLSFRFPRKYEALLNQLCVFFFVFFRWKQSTSQQPVGLISPLWDHDYTMSWQLFVALQVWQRRFWAIRDFQLISINVVIVIHLKSWTVLLKDAGLPGSSGSLSGAELHCRALRVYSRPRGNWEESCTFRLTKVLFTRVLRRSHEDWNTHRQPSGSVMDINLMRRVKKLQLTEKA